MIADNETNIVFFSDLLKSEPEYRNSYNQITKVLDKKHITYEFLQDTRDIWARDYMPIQVSENKFIEYRYDPDYLQGTGKGRRDLKTYPDIVCEPLNFDTVKTDIILDGGNVVKASNAVILTDKVVIENNRYYTKRRLEEELRKLFEVDKVILIPWDEEDEYGHADGMIRFIDDSRVLLNGLYEKVDDDFKRELLRPLEKNGLDCRWLRFDVEKPDKRNWAYINFLQTSGLILVPELGIDEDIQALEQLAVHFPEYDQRNGIEKADMTKIVKKKGALNCISWTIKS